MLSNTDFADLLKSGASNGLTTDGKGRFGLEQVKTWDKQNNAQGKKKPSSFGKTPARGGDDDEPAAPKPDKYRDRAFERRKDVVTSEDAALEAVVSRLDAEQTKFLGGDVEHTHLVRGLDYALLRKIREQEKDQKELGVEEDNVPNNLEKNILDHKVKKILPVKVKEHSKEFKTSTILGENLKNLLLNPTKGNTSVQSKNVADTISRTAFDYDLSHDTEQDIPTTVSRSKKEFSDGNEDNALVSCILNKNIEQKLSIIFGRNKIIENQSEKQLLKRKRKELSENNKDTKNVLQRTFPKGVVEDIFADIGKYVPVGALEEGEEHSLIKSEEHSLIKSEEHSLIKTEEHSMDVDVPNNSNFDNNSKINIDSTSSSSPGIGSSSGSSSSSAKGIFSNLLPSFPTAIKISNKSDNNNDNNNGDKNNATNNVKNENSSSSSSNNNIDKITENKNKNENTNMLFEDDDEDDEMEKIIQINSNKSKQSNTSHATQPSSQSLSSNNNKSADKNRIFKNEDNDDDDENLNISKSDSDLMAPIRQLLAAQRNKEIAAVERAEAKASETNKMGSKAGSQSSSSSFSLSMGADGRSKVHRDVFGVVGTSGSTGGKMGEAMGHGAYDDYGGDNETYDSDQEDENEGKEGNTVTVKNDKNDKEERTGKDGSANFSKGERGGGGGEKKDYRKDRAKDKDKDKDGGREGDSSGQWRNKSSSGGDRQSAIRPRVENNRAARRAGK